MFIKDNMTMTKSTITTDHKIMINWVFDASCHLLFKAWTESERPMHWWGPKAENPGEMTQ
jgi:uncharacterized protein YndB with AHSA1/START domain